MAEISSPTHPCPICGEKSCAFLPTTEEVKVSWETSHTDGFEPATTADRNQLFSDQCNRCDLGPALDSNLCPRCQHLRLRHFFGSGCSLPEIRLRILIGSLAEIQSRQKICDFCDFLCAAVSTQWKAQFDENVFEVDKNVFEADENFFKLAEDVPELDEKAATTIEVYLFRDIWEAIVAIDTNHRSCKIHLDIERVDDNYNTPARESHRQASSEVSLDLIRKWMVDYKVDPKRNHVNNHNTSLLPPGFMVIDVEQGCVKALEAAPGLRYVALSYVWGSSKPGDILATMETIKKLEAPGYLCQEKLPATIWDSMKVCEALQVPFLWVDRLCIIQDDCETNKMTQIAAMDQIYSQAVLTICASGSPDSHSGLYGTHDRPRKFRHGRARIGSLDILAELPDDLYYRSQAWWKRAWTYQELLLSPNKLIFSPWGITFHCRREHNEYEFEGATARMQHGGPNSRDTGQGNPIDQYLGVVTNYNSLVLSFDHDIFNAFQGIFKKIFESLEQLLYGLPKVDFDEALLWDVWTEAPGKQGQSVLRAIPSSAEIATPSWSWACSRGHTTWIRISPTKKTRTCSSIAKWNFVDLENGAPKPIIAHGSRVDQPWQKHDDWGTMYAWSAWVMGCIEKDLPSELQDSSDFDFRESGSKAWKKWGTYREYWEDAFISTPLPGSPSICNSIKKILLAREKRGRVIVRAALAQMIIRCDNQGCKLQGADDAVAGILVTHHNCMGLRDKEWSCVALSIGPALRKTLGAVVMSTDMAIEVETPWKLPTPDT